MLIKKLLCKFDADFASEKKYTYVKYHAGLPPPITHLQLFLCGLQRDAVNVARIFQLGVQ